MLLLKRPAVEAKTTRLNINLWCHGSGILRSLFRVAQKTWRGPIMRSTT